MGGNIALAERIEKLIVDGQQEVLGSILTLRDEMRSGQGELRAEMDELRTGQDELRTGMEMLRGELKTVYEVGRKLDEHARQPHPV